MQGVVVTTSHCQSVVLQATAPGEAYSSTCCWAAAFWEWETTIQGSEQCISLSLPLSWAAVCACCTCSTSIGQPCGAATWVPFAACLLCLGLQGVAAANISVSPVPVTPTFLSERIADLSKATSMAIHQALRDARLLDADGMLIKDPRWACLQAHWKQ